MTLELDPSSSDLSTQLELLRRQIVELQKRLRESDRKAGKSKRRQRKQHRILQRQEEEIDYSESFNNNLFSPITRINYTRRNLQDVMNDVATHIRRGNTVTLSGTYYNRRTGEQRQFPVSFFNIGRFNAYRESFNENTKEEDCTFTGELSFEHNRFIRINRSEYGTGCNFMFEVKKYEGKNCFIPTNNNCFFKCFMKLALNENTTAIEFSNRFKICVSLKSGLTNDSTEYDDKFGIIYYNSKMYLFKKSLLDSDLSKTEQRKELIASLYNSDKTLKEDMTFEKCAKIIMKERYFKFLYKKSGEVRNGVMTLSKLKPFNKYFNTDLNTKGKTKHNSYVYLYKNHFCLVNKSKMNDGINEVIRNYKIQYQKCDNNVCEYGWLNKPYKSKEDNNKISEEKKNDYIKNDNINWTALPDYAKNTYIFDLETYRKEDDWFVVYACGLIPLYAVQKIDKYLSSNEDIPEEVYKDYISHAIVFVGEDAIIQMMKYLGEKVKQEEVIVIGHNAAKFDNYIVLNQEDFEPTRLLKTGQGLIDLQYRNKYTSEKNKNKFKAALMARKNLKYCKNDVLQKIAFRDSYCHIKASLERIGLDYKLPRNIRKLSLDHENMTKDNYREKQHEWEPYLKNDVGSLAAIVWLYSKNMVELVGQHMSNNISVAGLAYKGWLNYTRQNNIMIFSHTNKFVRWFIRNSIYGGRVGAFRNKFISPILPNINFILQKYSNIYSKNLDLYSWYKIQTDTIVEMIENTTDLRFNSLDQFQTILNEFKFHVPPDKSFIETYELTLKPSQKDEVIKKLKEEFTRLSISHKITNEKVISNIEHIQKDLLNLNKTRNDFLMAFDFNSLYPSAMVHKDSEYPKAESARPFDYSKDRNHFLNLFNNQQFRPRTAILKVLYSYPKNKILQHLPVKETVESKNNKKFVVARFRNGNVRATLTSVDIQEIVRTGGTIHEIYEGIVYEENFSDTPFANITALYNKRNEYKATKNDVGSNLVKTNMNSLYGRTILKDINHSFHIWNENMLKKNFDDTIMNYDKLQSGKYVVQKKDDIGLDVTKKQVKNIKKTL